MSWLNLVGIYGLAGLCLVVGYLFWDKSQWISRVLLCIGIILTIAIVVSELCLRYEELELRRMRVNSIKRKYGL